MKSDLDPELQRLFDDAAEELDGDTFAARVMANIDSRRRVSVLAWTSFGLVFVACAWLLSAPVMGAVDVATRLLPATLVDIENDWMSLLFAPINSVAAVLALGLLGIRAAYRRIF